MKVPTHMAVLCLAFQHALNAASGTWTGTSMGNWSDTTKWSGAIVASGSGSTANFNTIEIAADVTVHLDGDRTLTNLIFGDTNTSTGAGWILDNNGTGTNNLILAGSAPTITVNTLGTGATATISAVIDGSAGFTKAGAGTLTLSATNIYKGGTTISEGTLKLGAAGALGDGVNNTSGVIVSGSGILDLAGITTTATVPLTLNSSANGWDVGTFYNTGTAATFAGNVTLSRQTRVGQGNIMLTGAITGGGFNLIKDGVNTLELANSGTVTLGALQANRGTIQVDAGATLNVTSINVGSGNSVGAGLTLNGGSVNCPGAVSFGTGSGSASGVLTLTSGTLTVPGITKGGVSFIVKFNGGTLRANSANATFLSNATSLKIQAGGAVIDDGGNAIAISPALIEDSTSTGGGLTKLGSGTLIISGTNTYSGPTTVGAGTLEVVQPALAGSSTITVASGAVLKLDFGGTNTVAGLVLNGMHQPSGVYNTTTSAPYIAGTGSLRVGSSGTITLAPGFFHQQIYGIGGNFCQGDQVVLRNYNRYNEVFSASGLNLSFMRLATANEITNTRFAGYDAANVAVIPQFRARQPFGKIALTAWSPPEVMKSTGSAFGGTLAKSGGQYVYADFANWWLRTLQYYQASNALPDFVSLQNEPDFASSGTNATYQAGNYFSATETSTRAGYPQALAAVRSVFSANGFGAVKITGPDTTAIGGDKVPGYLTNASPTTVDAVSHHLYSDSPATTGTSRLTRLDSQYPHTAIPKFMTELNPFDDQESSFTPTTPDWMHLAVTMHNVFTLENANAYLVWNIMYGTINYANGQPAGTRSYYPLGHFSKFIRPNDWRVDATSDESNLLVSLYRHYTGPGVTDQLVLVLINTGSNYSYPTVQTSGVWSGNPLQRSWKVYKTANDGSTQQRLSLVENVSGGSLWGDRSLVLAPYSITTALINSGSASALTNLQAWRQQYFGTTSNFGPSADTFDTDRDGEVNLFEFATGQNPNAATRRSGTLVENGANLEFTYIRSDGAIADGVKFAVEWSDTLAANSWSSGGVGETILSDDGTVQIVKAAVPAGTGPQRFVRLKVTKP